MPEFVTRPDGNTGLTGLQVHTSETSPHALTGLAAGAYRVGVIDWFEDAVSVTSVPGTIATPTVAATGSTSLSVTWAAPATGGSAITSYDLRHSLDGADWTTVTGVSSPAAIGGLAVDTLYYVQVRANNAVGSGAWSASGSATTEAELFNLDILFSGHSLVGPDLNVMMGRFIEDQGGTGVSERSFITGSGMAWRWDHDLDAIEVHARERLAEGTTGIFVITEAGPIEQHFTYSDPDGYLKLFYDLAVDNGCERVYFYHTWAALNSGMDGPSGVIDGDSMDHLPWRVRPMEDLHYWEDITATTNALRDPGQPFIYQVPMGLAWGRLYDGVLAGDTFEVTDWLTDMWADLIHPNSLGFYFVACVHYATVYQQSPVGLPNALLGTFGTPFSPAPSADLALVMQTIAWDVVRSYANSGVAGAALAPDLSFAAYSADEATVGDTLSVPYRYATGWPAPTYTYDWKLDGITVGTGASYLTTAEGDVELTLTATNASGSSNLVLDTIPVAAASSGVVHFDGVTNNIAYTASNPAEFTYVLKLTPRNRAGGNRFASSLGFFTGGGAERLYPTLFNTGFGAMLSQFTYGTPGTGYTLVVTAYPDDVPICLMVVGKRDGTLDGGFSVKVVTDGVTVLTSTLTSANPFFAISQLGEDGGSAYADMDVEMIWQSNVALEPDDFYATFFDGAGVVQALPSNGAVDGNVPIFYQKGNAAVWNSELDINGNAYTLTGTLTDV